MTSAAPLLPTHDLATQLLEAQAAIQARDDFLAIAAHELRSPMNTLGLQLAMLETMAIRADERLVAEIGRARRNLDRYMRRATMLLDVSRLQAQTLPLMVEPVSIRQLVQNVIDQHLDHAEFRGVALTAEVEKESVGHWDSHMIEEILSNLVSNAIKYGDGTPVRLHASVDASGLTACFAVSDGGPGIDAAAKSRIFEKFERLVADQSHRNGFGLGLWIVGRMVMAHHGSIEVTAPPGGGSTFVISLPLDARRGMAHEGRR